MKDQISIQRLSLVHPLLSKRVTAFFEAMEARGLSPRVSQGLRTMGEQNVLYEQGRTKPGKIVTNAKGGQSYHNYGYAVDVCFLNHDNTVTFTVSDEIGKLGVSFGLDWGGNWTGFKDNPHFQIPGLPNNPQSVSRATLDSIIKALMSIDSQPPVQVVSPWAEASFAKAEKKGYSRNRPQDPVDPVRLRKILVKAGFDIKDDGTPVDYEQLIVTLDRAGRLN